MDDNIQNLVCPYCEKLLTANSFERGKWKCEHCGALLTYEIMKKFYDHEKQEREEN